MTVHAKHSPSQLHRIIACPKSVKLCEGEPNETSVYAQEGTMLHEVMEASLGHCDIRISALSILSDKELYLMDINPEPLTREQRRACEGAAEYVYDVYRELQLEGPVKVELESPSSLAYLNMPTCYGIADVRMSTRKSLHILDYKFGQGIEVMVKDNPQFQAYALGSVSKVSDLLAYEKIVTHVVQPRLNNYYGQEYTPQELILWGEETLRPALEMAESDGPCNPGVEQCRWCLAKHKCKGRFDLANQTAQRIFAMYAQDVVTDEEKAALLKDAKVLEQYIKDIKSEALTLCVDGAGFPGYKAVCGRSSRGWRDEKKAREFLLAKADDPEAGFDFDDLFVSKFLTPPKAEKLTKQMKKDSEFQELVIKFPGKPTLVPESDPREAYSMNATSTFAAFAKETK